MQACQTCREELNRIAARADAPNDLDASAILDQCAMGDVTDRSLEALQAALARVGGLGDGPFEASVASVIATLSGYLDARAQELDALDRWSKQGRILAEVIADGELSQRMRDQARPLQEEWPGSPFATGAIRQMGMVSNQAHFEHQEEIEKRGGRH